MISKSELKSIVQENVKLKNENNLLKQLHTKKGFFEHYFSKLPKHPSFVSAFTEANQDYFDLFGENRYSDYKTFQKQLSKYNE